MKNRLAFFALGLVAWVGLLGYTTTVQISQGGTGATTAGAALTALGGQASDSDLTTIAALSPAQGQGLGWDGAGWAALYMPMARSVEVGFTIPSSGNTPSPRNHVVTYTNIGTTVSFTTVDGEPAYSITATTNNIGYTPSAYTSFAVPTTGAIVLEQVWQIQQTLTNYDLSRLCLTSGTVAAVAESTASPARVCLLVKPDGSTLLETSDGATRNAATVTGLTWASGTAYQVLLIENSTSASVRVRAAGSTTVYTATTGSTLPAAATTVTGELYQDRNTGNTGGLWSALRMWRARAGL